MNVDYEKIEKAWFKPKKDKPSEIKILDELEKELKRTIKEHEIYDKKNNCEWTGYYFYHEILDKIQKLKKELV